MPTPVSNGSSSDADLTDPGIKALDSTLNRGLAGRERRLAARLIDRLALGGAGVFLVVGAGAGEAWMPTMVVVSGLALVAILAADLWLMSTQGQSIGKRAMNIRIVDLDGRPAGIWRGYVFREFIRNGLGVIPGVGPLLGLTNTMMIFRSHRQTLHDQIVGTYVVEAGPRMEGSGSSDAPLLGDVRGKPSASSSRAVLWFAVAVAVLVVGFMTFIIAYPNFVMMKYRAERAEVQAHVEAIRDAELAWYKSHGNYLAVSSREAARAQGPGEALRPWEGGPDWDALGWAPEGTVRGAYWVEVNGGGFVVRGISDVDGDGAYAEYSVSDAGLVRQDSPPKVY